MFPLSLATTDGISPHLATARCRQVIKLLSSKRLHSCRLDNLELNNFQLAPNASEVRIDLFSSCY